MSRSIMQTISELGCTITVSKAQEHLGDGVLLELNMSQVGDGRRAEVYLSEDDVTMLRYMLAEVNSSDPLAEGYRWTDR